ncbi:MAG: HEAT repeat domain-containing protein [Chloroflexi bacterium]|nr:HEAT repeat domain-containing protein [Chloroflexota bacterium]
MKTASHRACCVVTLHACVKAYTKEGLSGVYAEFLRREIAPPGQEERWIQTYRPILGLLAVAQGAGLTRAQLAWLTGRADDVDLALLKSNQYLQGNAPDGPFRLFHRSFAEFLLDDPTNQNYHIDAARMHRTIVEAYLRLGQARWEACDYYGAVHLIDHLAVADLPTVERAAALDDILTPEYIAAVRRETGWLDPFIADLATAARFDPQRAATLCLRIILVEEANSLVRQRALRLLTSLRARIGMMGAGDQAERIDHILDALSRHDVPALQALARGEPDRTVVCMAALALGETRDPAALPDLLQLLRKGRREVSWAAADALIVLNDPRAIPELLDWYRVSRYPADRERVLYILGWMRAEEAYALVDSFRDQLAVSSSQWNEVWFRWPRQTNGWMQ